VAGMALSQTNGCVCSDVSQMKFTTFHSVYGMGVINL